MNSSQTFAAATALYEQALAESRAELALSEVRIAKLRAALALEQAGDVESARAIYSELDSSR